MFSDLCRLGVKYCTWTWYLDLSTKYSVLVLVLGLVTQGNWVLVLGLVLEVKVLGSTWQVHPSTFQVSQMELTSSGWLTSRKHWWPDFFVFEKIDSHRENWYLQVYLKMFNLFLLWMLLSVITFFVDGVYFLILFWIALYFANCYSNTAYCLCEQSCVPR